MPCVLKARHWRQHRAFLAAPRRSAGSTGRGRATKAVGDLGALPAAQAALWLGFFGEPEPTGQDHPSVHRLPRAKEARFLLGDCPSVRLPAADPGEPATARKSKPEACEPGAQGVTQAGQEGLR